MTDSTDMLKNDEVPAPEGWENPSLEPEDAEATLFVRDLEWSEVPFAFEEWPYEDRDTIHVHLDMGKREPEDYYVQLSDSDLEAECLTSIYQQLFQTADEAVDCGTTLMELYDEGREKVLEKNLQEFSEEMQRQVDAYQRLSDTELVETYLDGDNPVAVFDGSIGSGQFRNLQNKYSFDEMQAVSQDGESYLQVTFNP